LLCPNHKLPLCFLQKPTLIDCQAHKTAGNSYELQNSDFLHKLSQELNHLSAPVSHRSIAWYLSQIRLYKLPLSLCIRGNNKFYYPKVSSSLQKQSPYRLG